MSLARDNANHTDPFDLQRFVQAQERVYSNVLAKLRSGHKRTHWMWFIFPQFAGLGYSSTSKHYAIKSIQEAQQYLAHPVLGTRLLECVQTVLSLQGRTVSAIFGSPDDLKLRSSMTLFAAVLPPKPIFTEVLNRYFAGQPDSKTFQLIQQQSNEDTANTKPR